MFVHAKEWYAVIGEARLHCQGYKSSHQFRQMNPQDVGILVRI